MIQEQYISFEVAKLLKNRDDFHISSKSHYNAEGNLYFTNMSHYNITAGDGCIAPTQQLVMRWLRELHNIFIQVDYIWSPKELYTYTFDIHNMKNARSIFSTPYGESFNSYEETCEAAIKYCLENLI